MELSREFAVALAIILLVAILFDNRSIKSVLYSVEQWTGEHHAKRSR
jgi:hypothetical protein